LPPTRHVWSSNGGLSANGLAGAGIGVVAPTTRDDLGQLVSAGYSFNPVAGPMHMVGGFVAGAFP
jgi:hypothetical protein